MRANTTVGEMRSVKNPGGSHIELVDSEGKKVERSGHSIRKKHQKVGSYSVRKFAAKRGTTCIDKSMSGKSLWNK